MMLEPMLRLVQVQLLEGMPVWTECIGQKRIGTTFPTTVPGG